MDIAKEKPETLGDVRRQTGRGIFANNCLLARRLVEKGVRFVQLFDWGWDIHGTGGGRRFDECVPAKMPRGRSGSAALDQDLEAARPARFHARHLGRRIRPHADERSAQRLDFPRARSSSARLHDVDGRRRREARPGLRRDGRTRLSRRPRTKSPSAISRRRCCTCSASIRTNSATDTRA